MYNPADDIIVWPENRCPYCHQNFYRTVVFIEHTPKCREKWLAAAEKIRELRQKKSLTNR